MNNEFEKHGCEFKNESECEEELDDVGLDVNSEEKKHYNEDDEKW